jgi:hypothetical protein
VDHVQAEQYRYGQMGLDPEPAPVNKPTNSTFGSKVMENECRSFLEETFQVPFPTIRPDFLKRPTTKRNLELDCYNSDLKLALEYQGSQHRVYLPLFHKFDEANFHDQLEKDAWKAQRCKELGIDLIIVPDTIPRSELRAFLTAELRALGRL